MRIYIVPSVFLLNGLNNAVFTSAFQTTTTGSKLQLPQIRQASKNTKTLIHRSPSNILSLTSSSEEERTVAPPSPEPPVSEQEEQGNDNAAESATTSQTKNEKRPQAIVRSQPPQGPSTEILMLAMGTNPRRIFLGLTSATGIALVGNLFGVTSNILTALSEEQVEATGLDIYFPRGGYKRCQTLEYTYVIPTQWVADTFLELAKAQRKVQPLDYSMQQSSVAKKKPIQTLPDSAYGPPGRLNQKGVSQAGNTNVSVIVSSNLVGFSLGGTLGTPEQAAETLLSKSIAPEGSGRTAMLLRAFEDSTKRTYQFEYIVDRGTRGPPLRNIAVIAASRAGDKLYTLTVVAPAEKWKNESEDTELRKISDSFHLR